MSTASILLITRILDIVIVGAEMLPEIRERAKGVNDKLRAFAEEGRDPHPHEVAELNAETDELMAQLMGEGNPDPDAGLNPDGEGGNDPLTIPEE